MLFQWGKYYKYWIGNIASLMKCLSHSLSLVVMFCDRSMQYPYRSARNYSSIINISLALASFIAQLTLLKLHGDYDVIVMFVFIYFVYKDGVMLCKYSLSFPKYCTLKRYRKFGMTA